MTGLRQRRYVSSSVCMHNILLRTLQCPSRMQKLKPQLLPLHNPTKTMRNSYNLNPKFQYAVRVREERSEDILLSVKTRVPHQQCDGVVMGNVTWYRYGVRYLAPWYPMRLGQTQSKHYFGQRTHCLSSSCSKNMYMVQRNP